MPVTLLAAEAGGKTRRQDRKRWHAGRRFCCLQMELMRHRAISTRAALLRITGPALAIQGARAVHDSRPAGKAGEIVRTFNQPGDFDFACLIAGHYHSGMVDKVKVAAR